MKFFVDTAEIDQIAELNALGMVDGVTTNPSLIMKSGRDIIGVTREICSIVSGPVSAEVTATEATAMIAEGRKLGEIAENIAVKVPLTQSTHSERDRGATARPRSHAGRGDSAYEADLRMQSQQPDWHLGSRA